MKTLLKSKLTLLLTKDKEVQALVVGYDYVTNNLVAQVNDNFWISNYYKYKIYTNCKCYNNYCMGCSNGFGTIIYCN